MAASKSASAKSKEQSTDPYQPIPAPPPPIQTGSTPLEPPATLTVLVDNGVSE
ncbi:hypothetical protein PtA15_1A517 [Puccinia triticina]|uniref:Uncharacterized protein n=1 Tax=Puccinia triticina TaxID=208348 RepID=A0ABY7C9X0_9BASI|nr:uncharacterized protein PtA15_1A517 [Puccinia triticina]WAQ81178.1 hypothetical protein PtA15_1A517 [Puccinia triticina]